MAELIPCDDHDAWVAQSWKRCRETHLLPARTALPEYESRFEEVGLRLERLQDENQRVFREIARAAAIVRRSGAMLVLTDADRVVVNRLSSSPDTSASDADRIALGSCWRERVSGTNGVQMALLAGRAFTVRGDDHYYRILKDFACTSVPLFDADNELLASLTYSTVDTGRFSDYLFAEHLIGSAARRIHQTLFLERHRFHRILELSPSSVGVASARSELALLGVGRGFAGSTVSSAASEALLAIDSDGSICGCSTAAEQLLGCEQPRGLLGRMITDVLPLDPNAIDSRSVDERVPWHSDSDLTVRSVPVDDDLPATAKAVPTTHIAQRRHIALDRLVVGHPELGRQLHRAARVFEQGMPVHVIGPGGSGKSTLISALLEESRSAFTVFSCNAAASGIDGSRLDMAMMQQIHAATCLEGLPLQVLVIENVDELSATEQSCLVQLLEWLEQTSDNRAGQAIRNLRILTSSRQAISDLDETAFRHDLASHLCASTTVAMPELQYRPDRRRLLERLATEFSGKAVSISADAWSLLDSYHWPGNLRQARAMMQEALLCGDGVHLSALDLPDTLKKSSEPCEKGRSEAHSGALLERQSVVDALHSSGWNVSLAARRLGVGRATLNRRIARYKLLRPGD